jgi:hypothetical protein
MSPSFVAGFLLLRATMRVECSSGAQKASHNMFNYATLHSYADKSSRPALWQPAVWGEDMDTGFENYLFKLSVKAYYEQAVMPPNWGVAE